MPEFPDREELALRWRKCAARRVLKNGPRLRKTYAGEPFNELVDRRTVFEILKKCRYRYSRAAKKPSAAVALRVVFNGITDRPVNHAESIALDGNLASFQTVPQMDKQRLAISVYLPQATGDKSARSIGADKSGWTELLSRGGSEAVDLGD